MKILQLHNFYRIRGGECSVVHAERALLEQGGHQVVPYYRDSLDIDRWGMLAKAGMLLRVPYNKAVEKDLTAFVCKEQPDVAHVHNVFPLLTPAVYRSLKQCHVPVVQTVHNFRFLCPNGQFFIDEKICTECQGKHFFSAVRKRCMQNNALVSTAYAAAIAQAWKRGIFLHDIDQYIALNKFFADLLIDAGIPRSHVQVLGNFISEGVGAVPKKGNYILYLGRLSREKGIHTLLDAWEHIEGVVLKIAGNGPLFNEIENRVVHMGRDKVQLLGHVTGNDKHELIKGAMCMVVPSEWYENFPISVVEAMSFGTPVVVSRIGGLPELVNDGVSGLVFEPGDSNALTQSLHEIISDRSKAARLAENALSLARDELGPEKHFNGLINIYSHAIHDNKKIKMTEDQK